MYRYADRSAGRYFCIYRADTTGTATGPIGETKSPAGVLLRPFRIGFHCQEKRDVNRPPMPDCGMESREQRLSSPHAETAETYPSHSNLQSDRGAARCLDVRLDEERTGLQCNIAVVADDFSDLAPRDEELPRDELALCRPAYSVQCELPLLPKIQKEFSRMRFRLFVLPHSIRTHPF
jgi:hypothetical protein